MSFLKTSLLLLQFKLLKCESFHPWFPVWRSSSSESESVFSTQKSFWVKKPFFGPKGPLGGNCFQKTISFLFVMQVWILFILDHKAWTWWFMVLIKLQTSSLGSLLGCSSQRRKRRRRRSVFAASERRRAELHEDFELPRQLPLSPLLR